MYKNGIIIAILEIISSLLELPFSFAIQQYGFTTFNMQSANDIITNTAPSVILLAIIGFWINITIKLVCAILGDYWYKNHTVNTIKQIKSTNNDIDTAYRQKGGVNFILFFLTTMLVEYIPIIIFSFIS